MVDERWQRLLGWMRGENVAYDLREYEGRVDAILEAAVAVRDETDEALGESFGRLRRRVAGKPTSILDELLVETYARVFEAARRELGFEAHPEQVLAAIVLHESGVAEMATGEGKTLVAVFPAVLNALAGRGVHVLTPNDYLAERDARWMGPVYGRLGLAIGAVTERSSQEARYRAYRRHVTYSTPTEVGFDVLRDGLAMDRRAQVLRPLYMGIWDDIDSTLIDEARHPLVVAGEDPEPEPARADLAAVVRLLKRGRDYDIDHDTSSAYLTDRGAARVEEVLRCGDLYTPDNVELLTKVNLALHAEALLRRDEDYLVRDGRIVLIDEHRGRVAAGRRWPHGLQGAVEDKEGLERTPPSRVLASTTLQATSRLYPRRAGMSATAYRAADELGALYGMKVVYIPPHRECIREDLPDVIFTHGEARDAALLAAIVEAHEAGRPVLVGTQSVDASERLGAALRQRGLAPEILNAKNDAREAEIIARAGDVGAITISTRMAGRGTDIRLGGPDEARRDAVVAAGGLLVLGQGRAESVRIDEQLRGRAGRQGDPGASRFYVSLDDPMIRRHGVVDLLPRAVTERRRDEPIEDRRVPKEIARAQRIVAARNASSRKTVYLCEGYLEKQRRLVQQRRQRLLAGESEDLLASDERSAERFERLRADRGDDVAHRVERTLSIACIDRGWAEHLERIADVRESIQLMALGVAVGTGFGRQRPLDVFRSQARDSFDEMEEAVDQRIVESFVEAEIDAKGRVDLAALGLERPRRTWTYLLKEQPLETQPRLRLMPSLLKSIFDGFRGKKA